MWLKSPLRIEVEHEVNGRFLADHLRNYEVICVKVKMALYSNAGTLFESTRFPGIMEVQGYLSISCQNTWFINYYVCMYVYIYIYNHGYPMA